MREKLHNLSLLLIKSEYKSFSQVLNEAKHPRKLSLIESVPYKSELYIALGIPNPPKWLPYLNVFLSRPPKDLFNILNSAVLLFEAKHRIFALTFGHGKHIIKPESFETDFGLKVALNTVDVDKLKRITS